MLRTASGVVSFTLLAAFEVGTCSRAPVTEVAPTHPASTATSATPAPVADAAVAEVAVDAAPPEDPAIASAPTDPMATHFASQAELQHLLWFPEAETPAAQSRRSSLLAYLVAPSPGHFNQGNVAIAHHTISKKQCLEGLKGFTIQTEEQKDICGGAPNMVPIFANGDPRSAKVCIDIFEFPNKACELPFVWGTPLEAETICKMEGKRLCADKEWNMACSADPLGVKSWPYAYGEQMDMAACHTNVSKRKAADGKTWLCNTHDAQASWSTCSTDTEPSGAFPRCRSRLGVFDQHGNVAEEMFRKDGEAVWTQLKGSAWFYIDVGREPGKPAWHPERESYPDTCNYDPRWHVEELKKSLHVNYHLGFRCCKDVPKVDASKGDAGAATR